MPAAPSLAYLALRSPSVILNSSLENKPNNISASFNVPRFLFNPSACLDEHMLQFKFLGILMGVAIRTKKPLDLHLAPLVWKQLCCIPLLLEDLEEVDLLYVQTLKSILHIEDSGITEENFHEVGHVFFILL